MNKKIIVFLTMALVLALTAPVMAQPFQDVPQNHWAYDSLKQVAKAGLINGYNNGEFKGNEALTRYEVAALTSKVLDKIETEDTELSEDVAKALEELAGEFDNELAKVNGRLEEMDTVKITGETGVKYEDTEVNGDGVAYKDPYIQDLDDDGDIDDDDMILAEDSFKHIVEAGINIAKDGVTAELDLEAVNNYFGSQTDEGFGEAGDNGLVVESLSGKVTTDKFEATIGDEQELGWKDYLFGGEEDINGVIFKGGNSTVALGRDDSDAKSFAARQENLFNLPVGVFLGIEDNGERTTVAGAEGAFKLAGVDITGEVAANDTSLEGKLARLGLSKNIDKIKLAADYQYTDNFATIQKDADDYEEGEETTLSAEVVEENPYVLYGVNVFGNYEYELNSEDQERYLEANREIGDVKLAAFYDYENTNDDDDSNDTSDKVVSVAYAPQFKLAGVNLTPQAKIAAIYDKDDEQYLNQEAGLNAAYNVTDKLTVNGGYEWANKEARVDIAGEKVTANAGVEYKVTEGSAAKLTYEQMDFTGEEDTNSFDTRSIVGEYSIKF